MKQDNIKPLLFISDNFPPVIGGSSTVYDQICKNNTDQVVALSSKTNNKGEYKTGINEYDQRCGYTMYRTESLRVPPEPKSKPNKLTALFNEVWLILTLMFVITKLSFKHKTKVICVGELVYGGWIVLFSRYILRKRTIIYTHGEEISQASSGLYNKHRGVFLRAAHKIISVSLFCKSQIVSLYKVEPSKVEVISNGVDTGRFQKGDRDHSLLASHGITENDKVILSVGRLVKRKGHYNLIKAMQEVIIQEPTTKLIIIGSGPEENNLTDLAVKLELRNNILFLTNINDTLLLNYYQSADIFTMPNITLADGDTEGFGLVFLEANACAKPVVGGQAGGAIEAIIHNETGFLVDGYNKSEIASALLKLMNDNLLYEQMVKKSWAHAQNSTWENKAKLFNFLLEENQRSTAFPTYKKFPHSVTAKNLNKQKRLHITVDFEEMFDWSDLTNKNISVGGIDKISEFHDLCLSHKILPTYLVTYNVLQSEKAVKFLNSIKNDGSAIGIHLHPWNNPPYIEKVNSFNSFQCNLPGYVEKLKLEALIEQFIDKLGFTPNIHRAGRYGCSQQTLEHLKSFGISIDLSPSSGYDFSLQGGPNFQDVGSEPFWSDPSQKNLCIPIPSVRFFKGPDYLTKLESGDRPFNRFIGRVFKYLLPSTAVRLSPEGNDLDRMKIIGTNLNQQGVADFVLSVHSTSLYAGGNEYAQNEQEAKNNIDNIISYALWSRKNLETVSANPLSTFTLYPTNRNAN